MSSDSFPSKVLRLLVLSRERRSIFGPKEGELDSSLLGAGGCDVGVVSDESP